MIILKLATLNLVYDPCEELKTVQSSQQAVIENDIHRDSRGIKG